MKTFKDIRESKVLSKKKIKGIPVEIKDGKKGIELRVDGDLVADNFKSEKEAQDTAKEVLKALGK
jgi:uncharacterized protein (DUF4415 family)